MLLRIRRLHRLLKQTQTLTEILGRYVLYLSISIALLIARAFQKRFRPKQLTLCRSLHVEALQAIVSEGLAQGLYVAARAKSEPWTVQSKGIDSTNAPSRTTSSMPCIAKRYAKTFKQI